MVTILHDELKEEVMAELDKTKPPPTVINNIKIVNTNNADVSAKQKPASVPTERTQPTKQIATTSPKKSGYTLTLQPRLTYALDGSATLRTRSQSFESAYGLGVRVAKHYGNWENISLGLVAMGGLTHATSCDGARAVICSSELFYDATGMLELKFPLTRTIGLRAAGGYGMGTDGGADYVAHGFVGSAGVYYESEGPGFAAALGTTVRPLPSLLSNATVYIAEATFDVGYTF
jgi:hypothetical protein